MPIHLEAQKGAFITRSKATVLFPLGIKGIYDEEDHQFHRCAYPPPFSSEH